MVTKILHVGLHKTGTTTLQKTLKQSRKALAKAGFHYPSLRAIGEKDMAGHHALGRLLAEDCEAHGPRLQKFVAEQVRMMGAEDTLFLSTESFFRYTIRDHEGLDHLGARRRYVEEMVRTFGEDCEILLTVRRPDSFAMSIYQESIKKTNQTRTIQEYIDKAQILNVGANIDIFAEHFAKVRILVFEELIRDERGLAAAVLSGIEVDPYDNLTVSKGALNVSLHPYLVEYKRLMNHAKPDRDESAALVRNLGRIQETLPCLRDKVALLSLQERNAILQLRAADTEKIATFLERRVSDVFPPLEETGKPKMAMTMKIFEEIFTALHAG
ncbi:hypothetical protein [Ruegeria arenilitoris]|uniref:hypothetical protein n=1 Tax=Ruegeria arenilitoris TaxID=1173585 RepID=UPI00147FAB40|nr:hypothetical protein [Ruegeria arenilitoris]